MASEGADIFYVCQKSLDELRQAIKDGKEVTQENVKSLADPEGLGDDEVLVAVDMRGTGSDFADVEEMVEKLGPKGAVEAFFKAREYLVEAEKDLPEAERQQPMSAKEWKEVLQEEDDMLDMEGEEEEAFLDDLEGEAGESEFDPEEDDGDAVEPPEKKAKTD